MVGIQCDQCCFYKKKLFSFFYKDWHKGKCNRKGNHSGKKGVCWMDWNEGEY